MEIETIKKENRRGISSRLFDAVALPLRTLAVRGENRGAL